MSRDDDDWYYKAEAYYEKHPEEEPDALEECRCGVQQWRLTERTTFGEDADGRRGVPLFVYECDGCGDEREVVQA